MKVERLAAGKYRVTLDFGEIWSVARMFNVWQRSTGAMKYLHCARKYALRALEEREKEAAESFRQDVVDHPHGLE